MSFGENISWISAFPMDFFGHVSSNPSLSDLCQMLRLKTPCQVAAASRQKVCRTGELEVKLSTS
jgi:hypothetical protein